MREHMESFTGLWHVKGSQHSVNLVYHVVVNPYDECLRMLVVWLDRNRCGLSCVAASCHAQAACSLYAGCLLPDTGYY